jgi:3-methyl-2-oxobutanoate hydroxymethyltransferase
MSGRPVEPAPEADSKVTVLSLQARRGEGIPLTMLTAYDAPTAQLVDAAGADAILVGDSLAMVVLGLPNTLSVTMDEMLHHARAVRRGAKRALVVADLPFMSYQADPADAVRNAGRFVAEAGMEAVKLEGGPDHAPAIRGIVRAGIPVMGHLGLTPQSLHALGGFRTQARSASAARRLLDDALALEDAGCFSLVLECIPEAVGTLVTERLRIPTFGIGAGRWTSGQVLVTHDVLGLYPRSPRFARRYASLAETATLALTRFCDDVRQRRFPSVEHVFAMPREEAAALRKLRGSSPPGRPRRLRSA